MLEHLRDGGQGRTFRSFPRYTRSKRNILRRAQSRAGLPWHFFFQQCLLLKTLSIPVLMVLFALRGQVLVCVWLSVYLCPSISLVSPTFPPLSLLFPPLFPSIYIVKVLLCSSLTSLCLCLPVSLSLSISFSYLRLSLLFLSFFLPPRWPSG